VRSSLAAAPIGECVAPGRIIANTAGKAYAKCLNDNLYLF
jgi:hypothetical protein